MHCYLISLIKALVLALTVAFVTFLLCRLILETILIKTRQLDSNRQKKSKVWNPKKIVAKSNINHGCFWWPWKGNFNIIFSFVFIFGVTFIFGIINYNTTSSSIILNTTSPHPHHNKQKFLNHIFFDWNYFDFWNFFVLSLLDRAFLLIFFYTKSCSTFFNDK